MECLGSYRHGILDPEWTAINCPEVLRSPVPPVKHNLKSGKQQETENITYVSQTGEPQILSAKQLPESLKNLSQKA